MDHQQVGMSKIGKCIYESLTVYFEELQGETPSRVYDMVIEEVERSLLAYILERYDENRSKAAKILGLSRSSLGARIKKYHL